MVKITSHTQLVAMPSHVTYTPCTLAPRLPHVCEKNVFRFFCASASGKQHITLYLRHLLFLLRKLLMLNTEMPFEKPSLQNTIIFGMWGILFEFLTIIMKDNNGW